MNHNISISDDYHKRFGTLSLVRDNLAQSICLAMFSGWFNVSVDVSIEYTAASRCFLISLMLLWKQHFLSNEMQT